jgi:hypothetical protein
METPAPKFALRQEVRIVREKLDNIRDIDPELWDAIQRANWVGTVRSMSIWDTPNQEPEWVYYMADYYLAGWSFKEHELEEGWFARIKDVVRESEK